MLVVVKNMVQSPLKGVVVRVIKKYAHAAVQDSGARIARAGTVTTGSPEGFGLRVFNVLVPFEVYTQYFGPQRKALHLNNLLCMPFKRHET